MTIDQHSVSPNVQNDTKSTDSKQRQTWYMHMTHPGWVNSSFQHNVSFQANSAFHPEWDGEWVPAKCAVTLCDPSWHSAWLESCEGTVPCSPMLQAPPPPMKFSTQKWSLLTQLNIIRVSKIFTNSPRPNPWVRGEIWQVSEGPQYPLPKIFGGSSVLRWKPAMGCHPLLPGSECG